MAVSLLSHEVADLCLGKPPLSSLPATTSIAKALAELKSSGETFLSVWTCDHSAAGRAPNPDRKLTPDQPRTGARSCKCVGKICMADVVCYLAREENLSSPCDALKASVSEILSRSSPGLVMHVEPSSSLLEAIDLILQGGQNLVVPIKATRGSSSRKIKQHLKGSTLSGTNHNGQEFCWITQEDVVRYLLNSIGMFSPLPTLSIDTLGLITTSILAIDYHSPASSALPAIARSLAAQTSVAVVESSGEEDGEDTKALIGEISPSLFSCCDETVAAAIATLSSAGDLMAYIDCGGPPEDLVRAVMARLQEAGNEAALRKFVGASYRTNAGLYWASSSSSDEEYSGNSPVSVLSSGGCGSRGRKYSRSMHYSARRGRRSEAIVCHPRSSLVAVIIQAVSHRVNYVWVIEEDCSLVGIVTFGNMLRVFRDHLVLGIA